MITFQKMGWMGQLGNELSQYSTLLSIATINGYQHGIPIYANTRTNNRFHRLVLKDGFPNLKCLDSSGIVPKRTYIEPTNAQWTFNPKVLQLEDETDIQGFFQTEKYFKNIRPRLKEEFQSRPDIEKRVADFLETVPKPRVFLHVRRGDAFENQSLTKIGESTEYYHMAIKHFDEKSHFIVLSDDMLWCKLHLFNYDYSNIRAISERDLAWRDKHVTWSPFTNGPDAKFLDLELMKKCDSGIISNSSFSWWGAWLGLSDRKIVAPANWSHNTKHPDVIPSHWTTT